MSFFSWLYPKPKPVFEPPVRVDLFDLLWEVEPKFVDRGGYDDAVRLAVNVLESHLASTRAKGVPYHVRLRAALSVAIKHRNQLMTIGSGASTPRIEI